VTTSEGPGPQVGAAIALRQRIALPPGWGEVLLPAVVAVALATAFGVVGPRGVDLAGHLYQAWVFRSRGFVVWDNLWYAGRYSFVNYSVLFYAVSPVLGVVGTGVAAIGAATLAFSLLVRRAWGNAGRWSSRSFAVVWPWLVVSAALPFALGAAFALVALVALQRRRSSQFVLLSLLSLAASPLAFLFLALGLAGLAAARRAQRVPVLTVPVVGVVLVGGAAVAIWRLFPDGGHYPFALADVIGVCLFCASMVGLSWGRPELTAVGWAFAAYGVVAVAAYVVPSNLGGNVDRLQLIAVPIVLLVLAVRRWRPLPLCLGALALACYWNGLPLFASWGMAATDASASASYWAPAVEFLKANVDPSHRVEVVDTAAHWAALYLPQAGLPLARGWYRQDDFPANAALYDADLSASEYLAWLRSVGVAYVVLPDTRLDYSAVREARIVTLPSTTLRRVFTSDHVTVYEVPSPAPIVTGPGEATVETISGSQVTIKVAEPGTYRVAVRASPYWRSSDACVTGSADGMIEVRAPAAGSIHLQLDVDPVSMLRALAGATAPCGLD
jgi:hypothetical protein